jgi:pilus assembly protein TadC
MRFNCTSLFPELIANGYRYWSSNKSPIPSGYDTSRRGIAKGVIKNIVQYNEGICFVYALHGNMRCFQSDQLQYWGNFDFAFKLPPEHVYALEAFMGIFCAFIPAIVVMLLSNRVGYAAGAGLLFGVLGLMTPSMKVAKLAEDRITAIIHSLPFAIDLIGAAMRSGLDFSAAIRYYVGTENKNNPLAVEFGVMLKQMELGKNRIEALEDMARRIQNDDFSSFAGAVAHGTEIGASIVDTMKVQAEEMRRARFNIAERKAARAPSIMILPIAVFIMPAIFIVIGIPVLLKISSSGLGGLMK